MICQSWKVMFHAEYSSGQPVSMLVDLRAVVEAALAKTAKRTVAEKPGGVTKARAQAAGAAKNLGVPDFEVSSSSPDWSENAPAGHPDADHNK
jgi:spermidine/putrescine-binding protein